MIARFRRFAALVCALLFACASARAAGHEENQRQIEEICQECGTVGLSAAYVRGGKVEDTYAWGYATRFSAPMTPDTRVRIASISKVMVGLAAHLAAQSGLIDLDGPIDIPLGFAIYRHTQEDVISPRSILTHTSSIHPQPTASGVYDIVGGILQVPENIYHSISGNLRNWDYNNFAFYVLGLALERAVGCTMDEYLNAALCDQLDIDASFWGGDLRDKEHIATLYNSDREPVLTVEMQNDIHTAGPGTNGAVFAGNYHISARDLGKIVAVLATCGCYEGRRVLPAQVVKALEAHEDRLVPGQNFYQAQPLRMRTNIYGRAALYYHTGSAYGARCMICYDPQAGDGVVILSSGGSGVDRYGLYRACGKIAELLLNQ